MRAIERASAKSPDPDAHRMGLIASIVLSPRCFPADLTEEELAALMDEFELLPPAQLFAGERFFTDTLVWVGDAGIASSGQAARANLTYSFPPDGVTWGLSALSSTGPNDLNSRFTTLFGSANLDRGRELVRQSLASWRRFGGLTYQEVTDNGEPMNQSTVRSAFRGDLRIGGTPFGTSTFLAYNAFPSFGGDMCINTSYFIPGRFNSSTNNYRYFRNTMAHEFGHGLGKFHATPCNFTKLMEPFLATDFDMVTIDERRGAGRNYGDRYSGNNSAARAVNFGNLTTPVLRSVIERDLSTNGFSGPNGSSADWFRFTLGSNQPVVITVVPTGGSYQNGQQTSDCNPTSPPIINASAAGNLNIELRNATGTTVLQTAAAAGVGSTETLNAGTLAAGTYTVRVFDAGPNSNQTVQLYDMTIRVAGAFATPLPIAGVNKRVRANTTCWFMGNINSIANEGTISSYSWDLDGDGVFEVANNPQPTSVYISNGIYNATLRVTTSNGMSADDTITVTVFGATTNVTGVAPNLVYQSPCVPVTITGNNLKNLTCASMVTVSGSGVTVSGTPVPNSRGTSVSGLVFSIAAGAASGSRNVTVANADGTGTGIGVFTVVAAPPPPPPCPGSLWSSLGSGMNNSVRALTTFNDGSGPALYAGGTFFRVPGVLKNVLNIARWNGSSWSPLGSGMNSEVYALTVFDDGSGPALYAGGNFTTAGGVSANRIAKWNGSSWSPLGSGMNNDVHALTVFDDGLGSGPALYAGGSFTTAGGVSASRIAKWNGSSWSPLGSGMNNQVLALTVFDDGSGIGPALYAGGMFTTAGGTTRNRIAKWNGSSWSPLGSGMNSEVHALTVFDDGSGSGPALYAGGFFTAAGGNTRNRIAKWNGSSWSPLGSGMNNAVLALTVFNDCSGSGPALYAGGFFTTAGGNTRNLIAKWNGSSWSALGSGMNSAGAVFALTVFGDGSGSAPALYAGGNFSSAGGVEAPRLAKWQGCPASTLLPCDGDTNGDGVVNFADLNIVLGQFGLAGPALQGDLNADGVVNFQDLNIVLANFGAACAD